MSYFRMIKEQNGYSITSYGAVIAYLINDDGWKCQVVDGLTFDADSIEFINRQMDILAKTSVIEILAKMTVTDDPDTYIFHILDNSPNPNLIFLSKMNPYKLFDQIDKTDLGAYIVQIKIEYTVNKSLDYTVLQFNNLGKLL